ncbi:MAG TPA: zinc ABC transporter substrate-binding protein [Aurantimonas coralicida]|uniref:High-affinity zinc uptake system protein ZnuA n=2 Tax=root TaxID=1 RepID=A0A9C9TFV2_9HYPH|nr:zinc ABC transporter substrate-binding protein [Aurantimonas coralicida]HET99115.1 zinc ABC transporter substrate-binding protein [Aurantimonas coralicida]
MPTTRLLLLAAALSVLTSSAQAADAGSAPAVVASIKPIHSLVAGVMEGVGEPMLIVQGAGSPHTYRMKPSEAAALQSADVVFWAGAYLEAFLVKPLATLGADARNVELVDAPGVERLPLREGGAFETDAHEDENADEAAHDEAFDTHVWLDPVNAKAMVGAIEATLAAVDPAHAETYAANADKLEARLDGLIATIAGNLADVKGRPYIVFHDAYQYFERRFAMPAAGSITVSPETPPGARRIAELQAKVKAVGATCVFAEPQFEPALVDVVIEGTEAKADVLDPEGAALKDGPELYFELIGNLAASLKDCLS